MIGGGTHIIKGGIDLSVGAQLGLVTAVYALMLTNGFDPVVAIAFGTGVGLLVGLGNGLAVAVIGIIPLLATLAMQNVVNGVELLITSNLNVPVSSPFIEWVADGEDPLHAGAGGHPAGDIHRLLPASWSGPRWATRSAPRWQRRRRHPVGYRHPA